MLASNGPGFMTILSNAVSRLEQLGAPCSPVLGPVPEQEGSQDASGLL